MKVQQNVPFSVGDITAAWLSDSLREAGWLTHGTVKDINIHVLGEQVGFNGEVAIITPEYSSPSDSAPASLVLKIPTASKNRILGQTMGLYEKEIRFYRDLQKTLKIRTPRHFYSALDEVDDPDVVLERLQGMNRLPIWVIRILMALITRLVSGNPRKYVLLIEDLSAYRMGDQMAGCSDGDTLAIIRTMAAFHAQSWNSAELAKMTWIAPYAVTSRVMQMRFQQSVKGHLADPAWNLTPGQRDMLKWLRTNGIAVTESYGETMPTLLHGDFRLDNICFDDASGEIVLFDWQTLSVGPAGSDLAYFISATMPVDVNEERVDELIDFYHTELTQRGVDVTRAHLRWQYDVGMLCMLHRLLPALYQGDMDLEDERSLGLLETWVAKIYARLAHFDYSTALDSIPVAR